MLVAPVKPDTWNNDQKILIVLNWGDYWTFLQNKKIYYAKEIGKYDFSVCIIYDTSGFHGKLFISTEGFLEAKIYIFNCMYLFIIVKTLFSYYECVYTVFKLHSY